MAVNHQRIDTVGSGVPTEPAPLLSVVIVGISVHDGVHLLKVLKILIIGVREDRVRAVASLHAWVSLLVHIHRLRILRVPNLLHGKLDPPNLQNVSLLNFIVLHELNDKIWLTSIRD